MARHYIDFISAYCDSWCERCAFTDRCSNFAVTSALAMCDGDLEAAIELAIGTAQVPGAGPPMKIEERMTEALGAYQEPTRQELDRIGREMDARNERCRRHPLAEKSYDYCVAARRWLDGHPDPPEGNAPPALADAFEIVRWDCFLIHVKTKRALRGRDEDSKGRLWRRRVQNDWNGSAKVALISLERSERAWRAIAAAGRDEGACVLAGMLAALLEATRREFPRAMEFRRPGFDDPCNRRS